MTLVAIFVAATVGSSSARADLRVCNRTDIDASVAIGYPDQGAWVTEGWWTIPNGTCQALYRGPLHARYYYAFAVDRLEGEWQGSATMCVDRLEFKIRGAGSCRKRGFAEAAFMEIDTREQESWTIDLSPGSRGTLSLIEDAEGLDAPANLRGP